MSISTTRRSRSTYTDDFKRQMVLLHQNGKRKSDLISEYGLTKSTLDLWIRQFNNTGSFKAKDNRSTEENELLELHKELKRLRMENDILKQAALIIGRK